MKKYDFDAVVDRRNTDAMKYCDLKKLFGRNDLLSMWIADMDFNVCPDICDALTSRVNHHVYGYASVPEDYFPTITEWLRHRHGFEVCDNEITYIPGVVKGIGFVVNRFCHPGDKIVIQPPVYHPFKMVIEGNGCSVVNNPLRQVGDHYEMDIDHLRRIIAEEHPRMMILCNPHNPIGIQWDTDTLRRVADICAEAGMLVISDEIHGDLMLNGIPHIPFLSVSDNARNVGIMLGAPSKTFNIPGLVSSWCVIKNPELRKNFFNWLSTNEFNEPTFFATLGTEVAYKKGEQWLDEALEYIQGNIDYAMEALPRLTGGKVKVWKPQTSFLIWLDFTALNLVHDDLQSLLIDKANIALNDGSMFGKEGDGYMRMNVAAPRSVVEEGIKRIANAVNSL